MTAAISNIVPEPSAQSGVKDKHGGILVFTLRLYLSALSVVVPGVVLGAGLFPQRFRQWQAGFDMGGATLRAQGMIFSPAGPRLEAGKPMELMSLKAKKKRGFFPVS